MKKIRQIRKPEWGGGYRILKKGRGFWVKTLHLREGQTSIQSHKDRDEIWILIVPKGAKHTIRGTGDVLEIALGRPRERDLRRFCDRCGKKVLKKKKLKNYCRSGIC